MNTAASHVVQQNSPASSTGAKIRWSPQSAQIASTPSSINISDLLSMSMTLPERTDSFGTTRRAGTRHGVPSSLKW